jgi:hypothetical protein
MRTLLLIALLTLGMSVHAQDLVFKRVGSSLELNDDSTGIEFHNFGVGFKSPNAAIGFGKFGETRLLMFCTTGGEEPKGILMEEDGSMILIDATAIIIKRKTFASHAEADESLLQGEEYYISGDRGVYRKP